MFPLVLASWTFAVAWAGAPPVANEDVATVDEAGTVSIDVLANDIDPDSALSYARVQVVDSAVHGWAWVTSTGVGFTHDGSETTESSLQYRVGDGESWSAPATVRISIHSVDDVPNAVPDAYTIEEASTEVFDVLANDVDADTPLTYDHVQIVGSPYHGSAVVLSEGVQFVHDGTEETTASFRYRIHDGLEISDPVTVTLTVTLRHDRPIAMAEEATVLEGESVLLPVLANDTHSAGSLTYDRVTVVDSFGGTATVEAEGIRFTPDLSADPFGGFRYFVSDGLNVSNTVSCGITVIRSDDPPIAHDDEATFVEGEGRSIYILDNDEDPDSTLDYHDIRIVGTPVNGTAEVGAYGVSFQHDGSETTEARFQYAVRDATQESNVATVQVLITPINDPPRAVSDYATVEEGGAVHIPVLNNDVDPDDPRLYTLAWIVGTPFRGLAEVREDGIWFTHDGGELPNALFHYRYTDGFTMSNVVPVWITVEPQNDVPVAINDLGTVRRGLTVEIGVLRNDIDGDDTLNYRDVLITDPPSHGQVTTVENRLVYSHDGSEYRFVYFRYRIRDSQGALSNEATVTLRVRPAVGSDPDATTEFPDCTTDTACDTALTADDAEPGCGCGSGGGQANAALVALGLWITRKRRRA